MVKFSDFAESKIKDDDSRFKRRLSTQVDCFVSDHRIKSQNSSLRSEIEDQLQASDSHVCLTDSSFIYDYLKGYYPSQKYLLEISNYRITRSLSSDGKVESRYSFGLDFAITALVAAAAFVRFPQSESEDLHEAIESQAYAEDVAQERIDDLAKHVNEQSGGLSGSLSDYMFSSKSDRPTFIIGVNDTFVSIAEAFFQDGLLAYLIADLNTDRTIQYEKKGKRYIEVKSRDVLKLPISDDIEDFWRTDTKHLNANNLITIVRENLIDKEIVEAHLKPVLVAPSKPKSSIWPDLKLMEAKPKSNIDQSTCSSFLERDKRSRVKLKSIITSGITVRRSVDI